VRIWERLIGRVIAASIMGVLLGYAVGSTAKRDAELGRALTRDAYVAQFERHQADLENSSRYSVPVYVAFCVILALGFFGLYEGISWALERGVVALSRSADRTAPTPSQP